ncbi:hypothetical protein L5515_001246 [Caenorhabditis briggsae]|uniref:Uncharacterized protein n=1 Tax=Caenorhabditis briggsae TaxID=6238 RepID=A0AAE9J2M2_CAEBR|nr:hypothetical protein L5515_001246 [Caenorhabditis briggsae]
MALVDKVISILTIPDQNTNDSIVNSTDLYAQWASEEGYLLAPLLLVFTLIFCCICAGIQITLFVLFMFIRKLIGADEDEEDFGIENDSEKGEKSQKSMGSDAASKTPEDGTPRSRKSLISSQNSIQDSV